MTVIAWGETAPPGGWLTWPLIRRESRQEGSPAATDERCVLDEHIAERPMPRPPTPPPRQSVSRRRANGPRTEIIREQAGREGRGIYPDERPTGRPSSRLSLPFSAKPPGLPVLWHKTLPARWENERGDDETRPPPPPPPPNPPTSSMILPMCSPPPCAHAHARPSVSGKIMSITGATLRVASSGQTCASGATAISPLNSTLRGLERRAGMRQPLDHSARRQSVLATAPGLGRRSARSPFDRRRMIVAHDIVAGHHVEDDIGTLAVGKVLSSPRRRNLLPCSSPQGLRPASGRRRIFRPTEPAVVTTPTPNAGRVGSRSCRCRKNRHAQQHLAGLQYHTLEDIVPDGEVVFRECGGFGKGEACRQRQCVARVRRPERGTVHADQSSCHWDAPRCACLRLRRSSLWRSSHTTLNGIRST